jgi:hypothetical protein
MAARISVDTDTWWHLRVGKWIVDNGTTLDIDPFSYTRYGESWQYPGWLVEVPMYAIYKTFGPGGLNLWTAAMVTLAFTFVWKTLSGGPFLRAFVIILAASAAAVYWAARPHLATFLLASVYLWILEGWRWDKSQKAGRRLWLLPLLMIIWANSHGGFAVGFLLWGVYFTWEGGRFVWSRVCSRWIGKKRSGFMDCNEREKDIFKQRFIRISLSGLLMVLAVCINPFGPITLVYPFKTIGIGALQDYIQEWQSPDFQTLSVQPFVWLLILTIGAVGTSRKRIAFTDFALLSGFVYMGLIAGRNIALFALVAPMVLTRHAAPLLDSLKHMFGLQSFVKETLRGGRVVINWIILGIIILAVVLKVSLIYPASVNEAYFRESLPVEAVEYIKINRPPGRMINSYNWGGYLIWEIPEYPVFIDGRTDLYSEGIFDEWLKVVQAEDAWEDVLNKWDVRMILLEPDMPIMDELVENGWISMYSDNQANIFIK